MKYRIAQKDIYKTVSKLGKRPDKTTIMGTPFVIGQNLATFCPPLEYDHKTKSIKLSESHLGLYFYFDISREYQSKVWDWSFAFKKIPMQLQNTL